jgi:cytochrome P450 family 2 subfamily U polypeptide 1
MNDPKYWNNPQEFRPERFLENGKYLASRPNAFIPFGTGRRKCLGEKLAINDVFLVLVRLLQSANEYEIALDGGPGSADMEPDCNLIDISRPNDFKIIFMNKV